MTIANEEVTLSIAMNLSGLRAETRRFQQSLLVAVPLGLMLIVAGGWLIGHMAHSGQLPLSLARINLADLSRAAAEDARLFAPDRKTTVDAPQELFLVADADLLNHVFHNLVSNAVKFGDSDGAIEMTLAEGLAKRSSRSRTRVTRFRSKTTTGSSSASTVPTSPAAARSKVPVLA